MSDDEDWEGYDYGEFDGQEVDDEDPTLTDLIDRTDETEDEEP